VPVLVEGPWDAPSWKPDLLGALQAGPDGVLKNPKELKKELEGTVKGLIPGKNESGEKTKPADALKKLFK
ncbi:MAG: hypothetical protein ACM3N5_13305, partial [Candidatus Eiseniibacteriota bacterium]